MLVISQPCKLLSHHCAEDAAGDSSENFTGMKFISYKKFKHSNINNMNFLKQRNKQFKLLVFLNPPHLSVTTTLFGALYMEVHVIF